MSSAASLLAIRPAGGFGLIHADPPWRFLVRSRKGLGRSAEMHYATMTLADLMRLPVEAVAARDCVLVLWGTNPMMPECLDVMRAWGFRYSTKGTWAKVGQSGKVQIGTGYRLRNADESFCIGLRGAPPVVDRGVASLIVAPRREHSRKPEAIYGLAKRLVGPGVQALDLFSRETRPGWQSWGLEAGKFDTQGEV